MNLAGLRVQSAKNTYTGPGAVLDVTRGAGAGHGLAFAPSDDLVWPAIERRREADKLFRRAARTKSETLAEELRTKARGIDADIWREYEPAYCAEMRISAGIIGPKHSAWGPLEQLALDRGVRPRRASWEALPSLARDGLLVVVCFCGDRHARLGHCHRITLGGILAKLGATYEGEAPADEQPSIGGVIRGRRWARRQGAETRQT